MGNLGERAVSGSTVTRFIRSTAAALAVLASFAAPAAAQPFTGYELAIDGSRTVRAGRTAHFHGTAYRVRGLAELVPFQGPVRARFAHLAGETPRWVTVRSDAAGRFVVEVPIPADAGPEHARVEVAVGPDDGGRVFELPASPRSPYDILLRTDRVLYEPGEPVHVWALVRDAVSGRPLAGETFHMEIDGGPIASVERTITTGESGVASFDFTLADNAPEGDVVVTITQGHAVRLDTALRVGTRTWERLLTRTRITPEELAPGASGVAHVEVTTASGAPVRDAQVVVRVGRESFTGITGVDGRADVAVRAPAYLDGQVGFVSVETEAAHPAHGSAVARTTMRLAVPLAISLELIPRHGALVPELDDVLYVRATDGAGQPPPEGTEVELSSPAFRDGHAVVRTDANGLAEVPVRLPRGASATTGDEPTTTVTVQVRGALTRLARVPVTVARAPEVLPFIGRPVMAPGERAEVSLVRRGGAMGREVTLELRDNHGQPVPVERAGARASRVRFTMPANRIGLFSLCARARMEDESLEGAGGCERVIVRPTHPGFVRLSPERERWTIGETARVGIHTAPGAPRSFAAVLVRDLAAHGGERPFRRDFLQGAFDRAVLDPGDAAAERLARAALAASASVDGPPEVAPPLVDALGLPETESAPERVLPRDPWTRAHELARRGVAEPMRELERRLEQALASGGLDALTTGAGTRRRFRDDLLEDYETLGGGQLTPSMIEAVDPSFGYENVARRVARARLVNLMVNLAGYLDPGEDASPRARMASREPWERWLPRMVERGVIDGSALDDPWGGRFTLRAIRGAPLFALSPRAAHLELVSPGPDGRAGTADDVRDPFARVVPAGTVYAVASGEDALMRRLAILSPTERTLAALTEAYRRTNAEVMEEEIGDAVSAQVSEGVILGGIGTVGHGSGTGSGYGAGAGGMGLRSSAHGGRVGTSNVQVSGLARVVRERFPPTLLFRPAVEIDSSGTTEVEIPLADAVTTYLIETIVWREDGWIWSDDARIEVDRDIVIDAPVPEQARAGDRLRLPLRVSNRGETPREVRVTLLEEAELGVPASEPRVLTLAPGDAAVVPVELPLDRVGEGRLAVVVTDLEGEALDAVRRPIRVLPASRRVHVERDALAAGSGMVELDVPAAADPRRGRVRLAVGLAMLPAPNGAPWAYWAPHGPSAPMESDARDPVAHAFAFAASWQPARADTDVVRASLASLTAQLDALGHDDLARSVRVRSLSLIRARSDRGADRR